MKTYAKWVKLNRAGFINWIWGLESIYFSFGSYSPDGTFPLYPLGNKSMWQYHGLVHGRWPAGGLISDISGPKILEVAGTPEYFTDEEIASDCESSDQICKDNLKVLKARVVDGKVDHFSHFHIEVRSKGNKQ